MKEGPSKGVPKTKRVINGSKGAMGCLLNKLKSIANVQVVYETS